jgi:ABC-type uncharacterized transport system, ATPase component
LTAGDILAMPSDIHVRVNGLTKRYKVPIREGGFRASVASLFRRRYRIIEAVKEVSFEIQAGEIVGFLGPNGAGKTTTLKMLSGLLYPTSGEATVLGHVPWRREPAYLRQMTLVMGQKNQLVWDVPAMDTFLVNQAIYNIPEKEFRETLAEFSEVLELEGLFEKPVRNLSLGERMKCELVAALLHKPKVLFLDEPTLGLDVTMQTRIREFIRAYNRRYQATVLLTSHYMADIAALCQRVIIIHHGRVMFDGELSRLVGMIAPFKVLHVAWDGPISEERLRDIGEVLSFDGGKASLRVPKEKTREVTSRLLAELPVLDLSIEDPPIEDVIDQVFRQGVERI